MLNTEDRGDVTVVRIEHGRVGAMDAELLDALTDAVTASDRALVLTGTGSAFSAGVDLRRILDGGRPYTEEFLTALSRMFRAVFDHPRPTVAAVNGHAIAGGCVLALACDVRLMSGGRIGLAELAVGVPFPTSALEIVRHALGTNAGRAVLRAETVGPEQALALGMVDEVVAADELLPRALALAAELAARSPEAYRLAKAQLHRPANAAIEATTAEDDAAVLAGWTSEDTRRRIEAALEALPGADPACPPSAVRSGDRGVPQVPAVHSVLDGPHAGAAADDGGTVRISLFGLIYLAIGLVVALTNGYNSIAGLSEILSLLIAIVLWPRCCSASTCTCRRSRPEAARVSGRSSSAGASPGRRRCLPRGPR